MSGDLTAAGDTDATFITVTKLNVDNRIQELRKFYRNEFSSEPQFFVRVPGRVNIIGEHVDYCGYPVLPMAIQQSIILAVGTQKDSTILQLRNIKNQKFENYKCDLKTLSIDLPKSGGPEWYKYYLCGIKGIYEKLKAGTSPIGMNVALSGNIPPGSGLSSSSALVSAAALATAHVHHLPLERKWLASISANCERYIGTQGGGMDQAIAYLAKEGCAQYIEFQPELRATPIRLPDGICFVVANSLAEVNKAASSDFNERVVECRLACRLLAKESKFKNWHEIIRFAHLQQELNCTLAELEALAQEKLSKEIYTRSDICEELSVTEKKFVQDFLTENTRQMSKFKLRDRALHVLQESMRVLEFRTLCEKCKISCSENQNLNGNTNGNSVKNGKEPLTTSLSNLMQQSHNSLRYRYECSHEQLDKLVEISDAAGIGARLTGAGWGGCIVALCDSKEASAKYVQLLKKEYFSKLPKNLREEYQQNDFNDVVFVTFPCSGAEIFVPTS